MKRSPFMIGLIGSLPYALLGILLGIKHPIYSRIFFIMYLVRISGAVYGVKYMYRSSMNAQWLKILFWSNSLAWLIPPLGFFTSAATRNINLRNQGTDRVLFMRLAQACLVLSIVVTVAFTLLLT